MGASADLHRFVGKLITGKVYGLKADAQLERLILDGTISGVTLFKENAADLSQLVALVAKLIELGGDDFLITVDQEGGAVQRFDHVLTPLPSAMALGQSKDPALLKTITTISARQLRLLGVNCSLAPVLDINSNSRNPIIGTRAFGGDRDLVAESGGIVADCYLQEGVLPVGKHFPGHGDTFEDSHLKLAMVAADRQTLDAREFYPFKRALAKMPSLLVGHVWLTQIDKEALPASLSPRVVGQILRNEMGYDGFVMSDDMPVMKAIVDHYGLAEAAVLGINAGLDNLLISGTVEQVQVVHAALMRAVEDGTISEDRLQSALRRRARALALCDNRDIRRPVSLLEREDVLRKDVEQSNKIADGIARKCVKLMRGTIPRLIDHLDDWVFIVPQHPRYELNLLGSMAAHLERAASAGDQVVGATSLSSSASLLSPVIRERRYSLDPQRAEIEEIAAFAHGKNCLFVTFRALLNKGQLKLGARLARLQRASSGAAGILVASDVPYEIEEMTEWPNAVATFDPSDQAIRALADILMAGRQAL